MKINCPNALVEEPPAPGDPEITRSDGGQVDLARGSHGCRARYPELRIEFLRNMIGVATEKLSGVSGKSALRLAPRRLSRRDWETQLERQSSGFRSYEQTAIFHPRLAWRKVSRSRPQQAYFRAFRSAPSMIQ